LGWTPDVARRASIHEIEAAFEGLLKRYDATVMGFSSRHDDEAKGNPPTTGDGDLDRETIADKLRQFGAMFAKPRARAAP